MQKRQVLVIGAFTNGEEAAYKFISKQGWEEVECDLVFCGTNGGVVRGLVHGPAFAVVPVYNSIVGGIGEVVLALQAARDEGCVLHERDRFDLPINQCLMAPRFIHDLEEVREVISHEKALEQCKKYLSQLGIKPAARYGCSSTGAAAEAVAKLRPEDEERYIAAIAPYRAAAHYGLRLLAENIQDDPETYTTFVLLEHE